jgi:uncharacterized integral membrane protein (TIGR00698 family)
VSVAGPTIPLRRRVPGLLLVVALTALAYVGAALGGTLVSALLLALLLGILWRTFVVREHGLGPLAPGVAIAAGPLLRLGIVALGVRLDARLLADLGPAMLAGSLLGVVAAFVAVEIAGRAWGMPRDLRALLGIGTAICGASAIVAAAPVCRARSEHTAVAIAAISLVGTLGVIGFAAFDAIVAVPVAVFGALAGATLQEVGQVIAAGSVQGAEGADVALLVKLSRVVLLAPVLVAFGWLARAADGADAATVARPRLVPPFVLGFLALGAAVSFGVVPPAVVGAVSLAGSLLTAAAMAAIGLGVDVRAMRGAGVAALALGLVGMLALATTMVIYYAWVLT